MGYCYMPPMEAAEFAQWAAEALHRAGWNVDLVMQRPGEAMHFQRGHIDRYTEAELEAASKRAAEFVADIRVE